MIVTLVVFENGLNKQAGLKKGNAGGPSQCDQRSAILQNKLSSASWQDFDSTRTNVADAPPQEYYRFSDSRCGKARVWKNQRGVVQQRTGVQAV